MARTDNDTWDLASSVGATATMVAAARAMASRAERPLINDPFAEPLVRAVGVDVLTRLATGDLPPGDLGSDATTGIERMADNMAVRTAFFDEFFLAAAAAGVTQAVILASGLDSRAYRLPWPAGTVVFEIDQPDVIDFKSRTLANLGAEPTAERRTVAIDLREDWPTALKEAGFETARPTAWAAEGLLGYLPADAQDSLLDTVTALSAPGSRFATESAPTPDPAGRERIRERMRSRAGHWREHGFDLDLTELVYFDDRNEAAVYLADRGWQMSGSSIRELFDAHGLAPFDDEDMAGFADHRYVSGTLGDRR
ncbi:MAG TPA: class I SAM-dependent methyltransferase [Mycobacterium sp.]|jgi:methyltransferase (TIGR00027 family)|nr:class I SAM-dependent methyltransferase [Mycobacterium sp.]